MHPRVPPRRSNARAATWWGKAWVRAVEEAAYAERDLARGPDPVPLGPDRRDQPRRGGRLRRRGRGRRRPVDGLRLGPGAGRAGARHARRDRRRRGGRIAALLAGDLPHLLVEHAEEAGVELLPYGGELASGCTCAAWVDPCVHALARALPAHLAARGRPVRAAAAARAAPRRPARAAARRANASARANAGGSGGGAGDDAAGPGADDVETALDAALRAARLLDLLDDPDRPVDHLF